jgi:hypothetical protein
MSIYEEKGQITVDFFPQVKQVFDEEMKRHAETKRVITLLESIMEGILTALNAAISEVMPFAFIEFGEIDNHYIVYVWDKRDSFDEKGLVTLLYIYPHQNDWSLEKCDVCLVSKSPETEFEVVDINTHSLHEIVAKHTSTIVKKCFALIQKNID